jgi:putative ABC transport system substrate-binding protein
MEQSWMRSRGVLSIAAAALVAAALLWAGRDSGVLVAGPVEGDPLVEFGARRGAMAPGFTLTNLLDEEMSLSDFRGRVLVLAFGFSKDTAKDIENFRSAIFFDFLGQGVECLKLVHINKPLWLTKGFILRKMRGEFDTEDALKYLVIDWGGSLELDTKYGIPDKESPSLVIIGKGGRILYECQAWYSEDNLAALEKEIAAVLGAGTDAYLEERGVYGRTYRIGVTRIMYHRCFELDQEGFVAALDEEGFVDGRNVVYDFHDGGADPDKVTEIARTFVKDGVDLIHSMSIMGSKIIVDEVKDIPVVYSMVMDPIEEKIVSTLDATGTNVTGIAVQYCALADLWPVKSQLEMYVRFAPQAVKWGTVYDSSSVNTMYHIREIRQTAGYMGLDLIEAPVAKTADVKGAAESLVGKVDVIYITSDGIAMSAFEDIAAVCREHRIPLFGGELECVSRGALAAYNQDYFLPGYLAGKLAARILKGEKPGDIPSETVQKFHLVVSRGNAEAEGLAIPEELLKEADRVL